MGRKLAHSQQHPAVEAAQTTVAAHLLSPPVQSGPIHVIPYDSGWLGYCHYGTVTVCAPQPLTDPQIREASAELSRHVGHCFKIADRQYFSCNVGPTVGRVSDDRASGLGYGPEEFSTEGC